MLSWLVVTNGGKGTYMVLGVFFVLGKTTLGTNFFQYINSVLNLNTMGVK